MPVLIVLVAVLVLLCYYSPHKRRAALYGVIYTLTAYATLAATLQLFILATQFQFKAEALDYNIVYVAAMFCGAFGVSRESKTHESFAIIGSACISISLAIEPAYFVYLCVLYGPIAVIRDNIYFTQAPHNSILPWIASNGDVMPESASFYNFLIVLALWLVLLPLVYKYIIRKLDPSLPHLFKANMEDN